MLNMKWLCIALALSLKCVNVRLFSWLFSNKETRKPTRGDLLELLWTICIHSSGGGWDWDGQQLLAVPSGKRHFSLLLYSMGNMWHFFCSHWHHEQRGSFGTGQKKRFSFPCRHDCSITCNHAECHAEIYFKHISFTYRAGQFVWNHRQRVLVWRWAAKRAMIFENVEICAGDDVANALVCNYNPYFMSLYEWCALSMNLVQIW